MKKGIFAVLIVISSNAIAEDSISYAWTPKFVTFQVNDPDGSTETSSVLQLLSATVKYKTSRDTQIISEGTYYDFELDASTSKIGQQVKTISLATYYESRLKWGRDFKPWAGVGLVINMDEFSKRHTIDKDGFLAQQFPDQSGTNFALAARLTNTWEINRDMGIGFSIGYQLPLSDTLEGVDIGFSLNF